MAATAASDVTDGPVISLINKRLRALRKKFNRILQMEESIAQGKPINKEQEDVIRSRPSVVAAIEELEKLRQPLFAAINDEISLAIQRHQVSPAADSTITTTTTTDDEELNNKNLLHSTDESEIEASVVEDLLNVFYFGSMFDVKPQSDFTATMLTRTHERGCCLTYDYVTDDDAADLLGERDLDLISMLGGLLISRPVNSSLSHKNALQQCIQHARLWLAKSNQPIAADSTVTYAALRDKLNKIMSSDYFTTTPAMKAAVEVVAAAGNYGSFKVPVHGSMVPVHVPVQVEGSSGQDQQKEEDSTELQENDGYDNQYVPLEELPKGDLEVENYAETPAQMESIKLQEGVGQNVRDVESKEQQYGLWRPHQNQRGGRGGSGGGRRGYSNGRGGRRGGRGGQGYQNGRNQYYNQPRNYYPRYNNRARGGGGNSRKQGSIQAVHAQGDS